MVHQAFERLLSSDVEVETAAEAKRLLADQEDTEELTDSIQRFVAVATPVARIALGARITRVPWVLVASSAVSIGVTVRNGVRESRYSPRCWRTVSSTKQGRPRSRTRPADARAPISSRAGHRTSRLTAATRAARPALDRERRALVRDTRKKIEKALDAAERLDVGRWLEESPSQPGHD